MKPSFDWFECITSVTEKWYKIYSFHRSAVKSWLYSYIHYLIYILFGRWIFKLWWVKYYILCTRNGASQQIHVSTVQWFKNSYDYVLWSNIRSLILFVLHLPWQLFFNTPVWKSIFVKEMMCQELVELLVFCAQKLDTKNPTLFAESIYTWLSLIFEITPIKNSTSAWTTN